MALCSASSSPLTQFTKHLQTNRASHQDRLVLNHKRTGNQELRAGRRQHNQGIDEFVLFNASSSSLLLPDHSTRLSQLNFELRNLPQSSDSHTAGLSWRSEFNSRHYGIKNAPVSQPEPYRFNEQDAHTIRRQPHRPKAAGGQTNSKNTLRDIRHDYSSPTALWQYQSEIGTGMDLATCLSTNLEHTQFPSVDLEKTMEDFDWETLFASLDTTTRAIDEHADPLTSTSPDSSIAPGLVDDETACSTTESTHQLPDSVSRINLLSDSSDAFERGMRIVRHDDNLSLAVLAFEEACRAEPMRFEAWKMLGSVLAEVEREAEAILAFKEALKFDPNNLDVLMGLAVSYTNEGSHDLACQCLEQWMRIKYPQISIPELDSQEVLLSHSELFERIKGPFIQAARLSLGDENIDPDVQVGLGVLMFSAELYQMAADCFYAAIQSTELDSIKYQTQQHLLWNRYAACLGNIREKEEMAIQAYETALALKPNFVKARCNLGVLYHNINQPLMGAKNILEALMWNRTAESIAINRASDSDQATQERIDYDDTTEMYETLMKCCSSMCRWDLAELVGQNMDLQNFKIQLEGCGQ